MTMEVKSEEPVKVVEAEETTKMMVVDVREKATVEEEEEKTKAVVVVVGDEGERKPEEPKSAVEEKSREVEVKDNSLGAFMAVEKNASFREDSNSLSDLKEIEKKALLELRAKLEEAILENNLFKKEPKQEEPKEKKEERPSEKKEAEAPKEEEPKEKKEKPSEEKEAEAPKEEEPKEKKEERPSEEKEAEAEAKPPSATEVEVEVVEAEEVVVDKDIALWGVPLLPSKGGESTDVILLKFLRAREFKVKEAFDMLQNTMKWRKESKIDTILGEDSLGADLGSACYMDGVDREGHPICYNVYGVFGDEDLYQKSFGTEEKRAEFLRWRVQLMEKGIQKLDFKPGSAASLLQVTDLKNSPGPSKKELRTAMKQAVELLQDNYPELVARNIFVNVPFWYYAFNAILSAFLTQRTKSKFVFARPAKVAETLLKYISAEDIPISYGGLKRENDTEFCSENGAVSEIFVKAGTTETIEIPVPEAGSTLLWDLTVLGWEVNYKEEFVPTDEGSYTIIVQKGKKMGAQEEPIRNSYRNNEPGKVVLTVENNSFKRKRVLYRYKTKST